MTIRNNLLKNGVSNIIGKIIRIGEQLFLVPFFISSWGAEYYGEWLTLTIIPSMLAFSDLGFGSSAANKFLLQYAGGNKQGAANTARTGFFVISLIVLFGLLISFILIFILDHFKIFDKSLIDRNQAIMALSFLMLARLITFYNQLYEAFYRAARRASLSINLQSTYSALNIIFGAAVLISGQNIVIYALVNLIVSIFFNPIYNLTAIRLLALGKTHKGKIRKSEIKQIASVGFGYLLSPVWQAIFFQGTTFVVRLTLGPLAVALFNTVRTLTRSANQIFNMITLSAFPEFQFEIGAGNKDKALKIFRLTLALVTFFAIVGTIFLFFFGNWFYAIWTQKALNPPVAMWNIFLIGIGFNAFWWTGTIIFQAYNKPYYFTIAGTLAACISVLLSYFLSIEYGLTGAAIGSFILDFLLAFYVLPKGCLMLGSSLKSLINDFIQKDIPLYKSYIINRIK